MINVQLVTIQLTKTGHNVTSQKLVTMSQIKNWLQCHKSKTCHNVTNPKTGYTVTNQKLVKMSQFTYNQITVTVASNCNYSTCVSISQMSIQVSSTI